MMWICGSGDEWSDTKIAFLLESHPCGVRLRFLHGGWRTETGFTSCNTQHLHFRASAAFFTCDSLPLSGLPVDGALARAPQKGPILAENAPLRKHACWAESPGTPRSRRLGVSFLRLSAKGRTLVNCRLGADCSPRRAPRNILHRIAGFQSRDSKEHHNPGRPHPT